MKDKDDLALEALFRSAPIADDGFSRKVVARVRRRMWLRRLALPLAFAVGIVVAFQPAVELIGALVNVVDMLPLQGRVDSLSANLLPQLTSYIVGGFVVIAALVFIPALED